MARRQPRPAPRPPAWSRALTYFGFDAVAAERWVARVGRRWSGVWARSTEPSAAEASAVRRSRAPVVAGYTVGAVLIMFLAGVVLYAATTVTRVVADSSAGPDDAAASASESPSVAPSTQPPEPATKDTAQPRPRNTVGVAVAGIRTVTAPPAAAPTPAPVAPTSNAPVPVTAVTVAVTTTSMSTTSSPASVPTSSPSVAPSPAPPTATPPPDPTTPTCSARFVVNQVGDDWFDGRVYVSAGPLAVTSWTVSWTNPRGRRVTDYSGANLTSSRSSVAFTAGQLSAGGTTEFRVAQSGTDTDLGDLACTAT